MLCEIANRKSLLVLIFTIFSLTFSSCKDDEKINSVGSSSSLITTLSPGQLHNEGIIYYYKNYDDTWNLDNYDNYYEMCKILSSFSELSGMSDSVSTMEFMVNDYSIILAMRNDISTYYNHTINTITNAFQNGYLAQPEYKALLQIMDLTTNKDWITESSILLTRNTLNEKLDAIQNRLQSASVNLEQYPSYGLCANLTIDVLRNSYDLWTGKYDPNFINDDININNSDAPKEAGYIWTVFKYVGAADAYGATCAGAAAYKREREKGWNSKSQYIVRDAAINGAIRESTCGEIPEAISPKGKWYNKQ